MRGRVRLLLLLHELESRHTFLRVLTVEPKWSLRGGFRRCVASMVAASMVAAMWVTVVQQFTFPPWLPTVLQQFPNNSGTVAELWG